MDVFTVLGIFTLCFRSIICQSETTDCGTLEIVQPAVRGKDVMMTFKPSVSTRVSDIVWYRKYALVSSDIYTNTTKHISQNIGNIFLLTIKQSTYTDKGNYYIYTKDEKQEWGCSSGIVQLHLQELGACGFLYLRSPSSVAVGQTVRLGYIPGTIQQYSWMSKRQGNLYFNNLDIDGTTVKEQTLQFNDERVLTIQNIQPSQAGTYAVECQNAGNVYYTSRVTIAVNVLPKDVRFTSPNKTFPGCEKCLYEQYQQTLDVECSFTEGTEDASVRITVASVNVITHIESQGVYSGTINSVLDRYHMKEVKCQVSTLSLKQPLTVTSKLYVLRMPAAPVLVMGMMKQGEPGSIMCICERSRPPPRMFFWVGEDKVQVNHTDTEYLFRDSDRYKSTATLEISERRRNNKQVKCCLEHRTLTSPLCSDSETIRYEFPPESVKVNHSDLPEEPKSPYTIEVVCTVLDANPACGARLEIVNSSEVNLRNISTEYHQNEYGGTTTTTSYRLNVTEEDQGKLVTCVATCSEFNSNLTDSFTLTLPVAPTEGTVDTRTGDNQEKQPSLMWIIIFATLGLIAVILGVVMVLVIVNRRKSTRRDGPAQRGAAGNADTAAPRAHAPAAAAHADNDAGPVSNPDGQAEYSSVIPRDQRPNQQGSNQAAAVTDATYAVVIPKAERDRNGPTAVWDGSQTGQEQAAAKRHVDDEQNQPTELNYAELDLQQGPGTERKRRVESQTSEVEYSAVDFELSVKRKPDTNDFSGGQSDEENETIYMNE